MVRPLEFSGVLNGRDVLRLFNDADNTLIAGGTAAEDAGIDIGGVAADRAVRHLIFDVAQRLAKAIGLLARRLEEMERQTLRAFGPDARKPTKLVNETE
jgi:hypothetical protein